MAALTDEQTMLRDMVRQWSDNEAPVSAFRHMRDAAPAERFDGALWRAQAEMGFAGILIPEEYGGTDMGFVSLGMVLEQMGRNLVATPLAATSTAIAAIVRHGSAAQKAAWLPRLASGEVVATLAVDEGPVFSPDRLETRFADGRLTGRKAFVAEGDGASLFVVAATDGLYLAERGDGFVGSARHMVDSRSHAEVRFEGALAEPLDGGPDAVLASCDRAAAITAAEMLGLAESAFASTNDYLKTRVQFGQALSTFQALQHRMARMFTELELMRSAVEAALEAVETGRGDVAQAVSLAKALASDTLHLVSRETIQLHGGIGMTDEHDAGFTLKRSRVLEAMWGNAAWHRERFARLSGY